MRRAQQRRESVTKRREPGHTAGRRRLTAGCAGLLALGLVAAGCGAKGHSATGNTPQTGGTATFALPANVTPNYIFPFSPPSVFTIVNLDNLQYLMYRPLYWWGDKGLPYLNEQLSLADAPQYNHQVVTLRVKPNLKFSDGTPITAKNVMFWMNLMLSEGQTNWGGYVPGGFPDNIKDVRAVGTDKVQMTIKGKFSQSWFTGNELSQISPLPLAWDRTSATSQSDCADHVSDCPKVFSYLNKLSSDSSTWATSKLWKVVDGPWKLTGYTSQGVLTFSWNPQYSLPVPLHHITKFIEEPFTSEEAEFNELQAGGAHPLDVGYLPTVDAPVPPPGSKIGQNPVTGYTMQPVYTWGLSYIPYNFNPADPQLAIFKQLYFRQAFQLLVNQPAIIQGALHGYGQVNVGPVGDAPTTKYLSPTARKGDPFPYNLNNATHLLARNGWAVDPHTGLMACSHPGTGQGECGAGVKHGQTMVFHMLYATGNAWVQAAVLQLKSDAQQVGIQIDLKGESFDDVIGTVESTCGPDQKSPCPWELADWGEGWSYVPDYLPTGDELFGTGSGGNIGQYSNPTNDALIKKTLRTASLKAMYKWEDYLTQQLPVVLQPAAPAALEESINDLHIGIQSPTLALTPEDWYFVK